MTVAPLGSGVGVAAPAGPVASAVAGRIGVDRSPIGRCIDAWAESMRARGKRARSIERFTAKVRECCGFNRWETAADVTYAGAIAWLASKREGGWGPATYTQTVSALRRFGRFLHVSKECGDNPFAALEGTGEQGGEGSRALTTAEARAMILAAYARSRADGRARGNAGLFIGFLCLTGLRAGEAAATRWRDLGTASGDCDQATGAVLWTDPAWSKNKRRQPVYIPTQLGVRLEAHLQTIPSGPDDLIFPIVPNRHTWRTLREAAGIRDAATRGKQATMHSCRKWLATTLDQQGETPGTVSTILRHANTLAEVAYVKISSDAQVLAMKRLPYLFPEDQHGKNVQGVLTTGETADTVAQATVRNPMVSQPLQSFESDTRGCLHGSPIVAVAADHGQPRASDSSIEHGPTHSDAGNEGAPNRVAPSFLAQINNPNGVDPRLMARILRDVASWLDGGAA